MGLFDKISQAVSDTLGQDVAQALDKASAAVLGQTGSDRTAPADTSSQPPVYQPGVVNQPTTPNTQPASNYGRPPVRGADYFAQLIASLPGVTPRPGVAVEELGGSGKPYDFGLYRDGRLVGVLMLTPHNRDHNAAFKNAKAAAAAAGVPFINFYLHMPNEPDYVLARIRSFIG